MIAVRLPDKLEKKLNSYAEVLNKTKTDVVKEALELYFTKTDEQKNSYALGESLFGKYSSGKGNLSTTYKQKLKEKIRAK